MITNQFTINTINDLMYSIWRQSSVICDSLVSFDRMNYYINGTKYLQIIMNVYLGIYNWNNSICNTCIFIPAEDSDN